MKFSLFLVLSLFVSCFGSKNTQTTADKKVDDEVEFNRETVDKNCFCEMQMDPYGKPAPNKVKSIDINKTLLITDRSVMEALNSQFRFSTILAKQIHENEFSKDSAFFLDLISKLSLESKKQLKDNWKNVDSIELSRFGTPYELYGLEFLSDDMKTSSSGNILSAGKIRLHYKFLRLGADGNREDIKSTKRLGYSDTSLAYIDYHLPIQSSAYNGEVLWTKDQYSEELLKLQCYLGRRGLEDEPRFEDFPADLDLALTDFLGSIINRTFNNKAIWKRGSAFAGVTIIDSLSENKIVQLNIDFDFNNKFTVNSSKDLIKSQVTSEPEKFKVQDVYLGYFREMVSGKDHHPYISEELKRNLESRKEEIEFRVSRGEACQMPIAKVSDLTPTFSIDRECGEYKPTEIIEYTMNILNKGPAINKRTLVHKKLIECPEGTTLIAPPSGVIKDCDAERRNCHIETSGSSDYIEISNIPANSSINFYMDCKIDPTSNNKILTHSITSNDWKFETPDSDNTNNNASINVEVITGQPYSQACRGGVTTSTTTTTTTTTTMPPKEDEIVDYKTKFWIGDDVVEGNKQLLKITIHNIGKIDSVDPLKLKYSCPEHSTFVKGSERPSKGMFTSDGTWILRDLKVGKSEFMMWNCMIDKGSAGNMFEYRMKESDFTFPGVDSNPTDNLDWNRRKIQRHCDYDYNSDGRISAIDLVHLKKRNIGLADDVPGKSYRFELSNKADGNRYAPASARHVVKMQKYILGQLSWEDFFGALEDCADITPRKPF